MWFFKKRNTPKVFCIKCKYCEYSPFRYLEYACLHPNGWEYTEYKDDPIRPGETLLTKQLADCLERNKKNDCQDFEEKED